MILRTGNLALRAKELKLSTSHLGLGTWDLELDTWDLDHANLGRISVILHLLLTVIYKFGRWADF